MSKVIFQNNYRQIKSFTSLPYKMGCPPTPNPTYKYYLSSYSDYTAAKGLSSGIVILLSLKFSINVSLCLKPV